LANDGAFERKKASHLGRHGCLPSAESYIGYECRLSDESSSHTQSHQIRSFRVLPAGCHRKKLGHVRAVAQNFGDDRETSYLFQRISVLIQRSLLQESFADDNRSDLEL